MKHMPRIFGSFMLKGCGWAVALSAGVGCGSDAASPSSTDMPGSTTPEFSASPGGGDSPSIDAPSDPAPNAAAAPVVTPVPTATPATGDNSEVVPVPVAPPVSNAEVGAGAVPSDTSNMPAPVGETPPAVGPEPDAASRLVCTGSDPISCHFGGPPGNYDVTVVLGGEVAANTRVLAETRRVMLGPVATAAGETRRFTFGVNVRQPEGEPIQAVPAGTPGLDLYFQGAAGGAPALQAIGYAPAADPLMIYVAGDSTVADQNGAEYGGWAQQLPQHFDYPVVVANYSDSGESSGSFLNARPLFGAIESQLQANDWVLIQFGHNDKTVTAAQFHDNMTSLVARVKAKSALPVLLTPVARAQFNGNAVSTQHVNGTGANLPQIVAQVAREQNVPLLDLTALTTQWLSEVGPNGWQAFHALGTDVTHTNDAGAAVEAGFVRDLLLGAQLDGLTSHLR